MKEKRKEKIPPFKKIWTHIPTPDGTDDLNAVSEWLKSIIEKVDGKERRIIIVDDEHEVLNSLKQILIYEGYKVDTATNGIEALDKLSRHNFDLILSDIRMPAMDGIELSEICKNHPQLKEIPIVLFSGYYDTFESVADYFLAKPIDSESLLRVISKIFKKYQIKKEVEKIGVKRPKLKYFQEINIDNISNIADLQKILHFIWVFQPRHIPLFKISHETDLTIEKIRELLRLIEDQDTILIIEESPMLRELLKAELTLLGGNPARIFSSMEKVYEIFKSKL
ncbi:MAG: response regulator [Candidatus Helarchaeota archaeon]